MTKERGFERRKRGMGKVLKKRQSAESERRRARAREVTEEL